MMESTEGRKSDQGKPNWTLMPWRQLERVQKVLDYGAVKYGPFNWIKVQDPITRYSAALTRHMVAYLQGDLYDEESGNHHLAH